MESRISEPILVYLGGGGGIRTRVRNTFPSDHTAIRLCLDSNLVLVLSICTSHSTDRSVFSGLSLHLHYALILQLSHRYATNTTPEGRAAVRLFILFILKVIQSIYFHDQDISSQS